MPRILVTNDDGYRLRGHSARWPRRCAPLGDVTIVAPDRGGERHRPRADAAASAAARARCGDRVFRRGRHADRLREHRDHAGAQAAARPGRLGHQQGLEPRRRRDVFGHRGRRARRRAARRPGDCRVAAARRGATYDFGSAAQAAAAVAGGVLGGRCRRATFLNVNVPKGRPKGFRVTVQAKRNHVTSVAERQDPQGPAVLLDRGRAERLGAARSLGLSGGPGRLRVGDAAAAGPDRARCRWPRSRRLAAELPLGKEAGVR